jgi:hypothetical protein
LFDEISVLLGSPASGDALLRRAAGPTPRHALG